MKRSKLLALILSICLITSLLTGFAPINAAASTTTTDREEFELPDIIDTEEAKEKDYISRVKTEERDLHTFVFDNGDGTNTMRVYSHPVKYIADDGYIRDISLDIEAKKGGGFVTAEHEIVTTFENKLTDGITLEYEDIEITLIPALGLGAAPTAKLSNDSKIVTYETNDVTSFVYELTYTGFKEDIVVKEYTGQTEYAFTLFTNGLALCEEYGSYYLADADGNIEATIGDIIVFTADERNNTMGSMSYETVRANQEYVLTIQLDAEYLADEDTAYPIRIDPTIEINYDNNGVGAIEDVTINEQTTFDGDLGSLFVGRHPVGSLSRILMRFPNLSLSGISENQITSATVELRDLMCQDDEDITIECYVYKKSAPAWSEAGTTTWSSVGTAYVGTFLDSHLISYGQGDGGGHRYSFNILPAARAWATGSQSPSKGLVFKANSAFERQTGDAVKTWHKTFAAYNRSAYRPSLSLVYTTSAEAIEIDTNVLTSVVVPAAGARTIFKFVPSSTGFYTFESSNIVSGEPKAWLYNPNFEQLAVNDDANGLNFQLTYHLIEEYAYYFAAGCDSSYTGSYTVALYHADDLSDVTCQTINLNNSNYVESNVAFEVQYFKFEPTVSGDYLIYSFGALHDPNVWIYNADLNNIGFDDDGANNLNFRFSDTLIAGVTYYIVAAHYGTSTGTYNMRTLIEATIPTDDYALMNKDTELYLDIHGPVEQNKVHQWSFHTGAQNRWTFNKGSNGYYTIQAKYGLQYYIGVPDDAIGIDNVNLYSSLSPNTQWKIYAYPTGELLIEPRYAPGTLLCVPNSYEGTELQLVYMSSHDDKAKWKFEVKSETPLEGQQMSNWCWAASARMFANHYAEVPASRSQSAAVSAVKGSIVNDWGNDTETIQACNYYYSGSTTTNTMIMYNIGICSEDYLTDYLNGGDVMIILRGPSEGVGHFTTIVGYTTIFLSGELEYRYIIYDPWPVAVSWPNQPIYTTGQIVQQSYSWIRYGYDSNMPNVGDGKTWRYSIVLERIVEGG